MTAVQLTTDLIKLGASSTNREDAIRLAASLLVEQGFIDPAYLDSFFKREAVANTFLGNGVAIPHGIPEDRHLIHRTGIAVVQLPHGVEWGVNQTARLVVAIAAQSDEHLALLRRLTRLLGDSATLDRLATTLDPEDMANALNGEAQATPNASRLGDAAESFVWTVDYPNGLHARPASTWVETARAHPGDVRICHNEQVADAKNLLALLQLGIENGNEIRVEAAGPGASDALARLKGVMQLLTREECSNAARAATVTPASPKHLWQAAGHPAILRGKSASPGFVIAPLHIRRRTTLEVPDIPLPLPQGGALLENALAETARELDELGNATLARLGSAEAGIFKAQAELLRDTDLIGLCCRLMVEGRGPAFAWQLAVNTLAERLASANSPLLAARAADLRDVGARVLVHLQPGTQAALTAELPEGKSILVAEDLAPSDTAELDLSRIAGLVTAHGGPTSHTAILARTLGLPALVATGDAVLALEEGSLAILDADGGRLILSPDKADLASARDWQTTQQQARQLDAEQRQAPAVTRDGHRIEIAANLNRPAQVADALDLGAEGIGLMRTEFLFLESDHIPDEEEQLATYLAMQDALEGRELIVRLLDIGGDKQVPHLGLPREENPFLGVRGIRLLMRRPDLLEPQLRALYRAATSGRPLSIMFPMVTSLAEVIALKAECERIRLAVSAPAIKLGIMIEVPAAAALADQLAEYVDFFSIGTNDLTQYVLAIDRQHPELAGEADSLHPAVLRMIAQTVAGARRFNRWVGVCGGLAGDPAGAALLTGLGVDELSMSPVDIPAVKARIRRHSAAALATLAQQALQAHDAAAVRALLEDAS